MTKLLHISGGIHTNAQHPRYIHISPMQEKYILSYLNAIFWCNSYISCWWKRLQIASPRLVARIQKQIYNDSQPKVFPKEEWFWTFLAALYGDCRTFVSDFQMIICYWKVQHEIQPKWYFLKTTQSKRPSTFYVPFQYMRDISIAHKANAARTVVYQEKHIDVHFHHCNNQNKSR